MNGAPYLANLLGSSLLKPVTALSDAGFLFGAAAVAVDALAAGVGDVAAVVEAPVDVVFGSFVERVFAAAHACIGHVNGDNT